MGLLDRFNTIELFLIISGVFALAFLIRKMTHKLLQRWGDQTKLSEERLMRLLEELNQGDQYEFSSSDLETHKNAIQSKDIQSIRDLKIRIAKNLRKTTN